MNGVVEATVRILVVDVLVRATLLLAGTVLAGWALGRGRSGLRHDFWTVTFGLLLLLPALVWWGPRLELPVLPPAPAVGAETPAVGAPAVEASIPALPEGAVAALAEDEAPIVPSPDASDARRKDPSATAGTASGSPTPLHGAGGVLLALWALGVVGALASLSVGAARFRGVVRRARTVTSDRIRRRLAPLSERLGLRRPVRLLASGEVPTPVAGGLLRPVVILPDGAEAWSEERLDVVLTHELVHVRRFDALRQLLSQVALALYWFHPLSWLASRLALSTREQACDEAVLALGTRPSAYAHHLMHLSDRISRPLRLAALPMVHRTQLESRIMSILTPAGRRRSAMVSTMTLIAFCVFGVTAAVAIPVALDTAPTAAQAAPPAAAPTFQPTPTSPTRAAVPEVVGAAAIPQDAPTCPTERLSGDFSGTISSDRGRSELSGWHNGDRVIQRYVDGLRLCLRAHGDVVMTDDGTEVRAVGRGGWLVLESENGDLHRLVVAEGPGGIVREWTVDGEARPFDETAREWRNHMLAALNAYWEASRIRGQESSLRGEISSMRGHVSSLRGRISSHRGQVSSLRGQMSSMRGHVSSLKGRISSMRGHVSSLNGQVSSLRGRISSLRGAVRATDDPATRQGLAEEIAGQEARIDEVMEEIEAYDLESRVAEVEREIDEYDLDGRVAAVEREIEGYDLDGKVAELEREIEEFDLEGRVREKEREIEALEADRRADEAEATAEPHLEALRRLLGR